MLNNEQVVAKAIMKQDRAPLMRDDDYFEIFATQLIGIGVVMIGRKLLGESE